MKVIMPVFDIVGGKDNIAKSFQNTEFACVYNMLDQTTEWLPLSQISKNIGNLSLELKRKGIYTIICNSMPLIAWRLFNESGIKLLEAASSSVSENIELCCNNLLKPLSLPAALKGAGCGSACSSCKTVTCS